MQPVADMNQSFNNAMVMCPSQKAKADTVRV